MANPEIYYIYIIWSESADIYYVGYSRQVRSRILKHNNSEFNTFTAKYRPWKYMAHFQVIGTKSDAIRIENFIKAQKSRKFIERLLTQDSFDGKLAQLVRVPKLRD